MKFRRIFGKRDPQTDLTECPECHHPFDEHEDWCGCAIQWWEPIEIACHEGVPITRKRLRDCLCSMRPRELYAWAEAVARKRAEKESTA